MIRFIVKDAQIMRKAVSKQRMGTAFFFVHSLDKGFQVAGFRNGNANWMEPDFCSTLGSNIGTQEGL
jgi:hypothetical protein